MSTIMDNSTTPAYTFMAWFSFLIATIGMLVGILYLPTSLWIKGYLGLGYLFTVTTCLTLAKTLRDQHESGRIYKKVQEAKTEKILSDFEKNTI
ncbi:MAG: YiaA/YiaB family inner membrane protein [Bacteroidota bacterium]